MFHYVVRGNYFVFCEVLDASFYSKVSQTFVDLNIALLAASHTTQKLLNIIDGVRATKKEEATKLFCEKEHKTFIIEFRF